MINPPVYAVIVPKYLQSNEQILAIITSIDAIISMLLTQALQGVQQNGVSEYELDTGQTRQRVKYNSTASVMQSVADWRMQRQTYVNMLTRAAGPVKLVDISNFGRR